jgi:hypothetical protein
LFLPERGSVLKYGRHVVDVHLPSKGEEETPVPTQWRDVLSQVVDSLARRDAVLARDVGEVDPVSDQVRQQCLEALEDYGGVDLVALPQETWETSVASWRGRSWSCLVDLWTLQEGRSDLVMMVEVRESQGRYRFVPIMVYVP